MQEQNKACQLIDQHKKFNKQALDKVVASLPNSNKDYFTIAIIGAQNTGKSTLLNYLFKTNFAVLKGEAGNRTTRGVVLGKDYAQKLIIMDVEGNDSYQTHAEGDENYEKMVSSFALTGAHVLLVNIYEKQLGQHSGSQYETLSTVIRICIDQFKQQSPKTILFCLRDANPNYTDEGECRRKVQQDVLNIWKSVFADRKKSADFEKYLSSPQRFFTLEVAFLREYDRDYPQDFIEDVGKLRERFINPNVDGYLFKKQKKEYNLPLEDVPSLLDTVWDKLVNNKQLNLPNQKTQVANYRCQQFCTEIIRSVEKKLDQKPVQIMNYQEYLHGLQGDFEQKTHNYSKQITEKWTGQLISKLTPKIRKVVNELIQQQQKQVQTNFPNNLNDLFFDLSQPDDNFKVQAEKVKIRTINQLVSFYRQINFQIPDRKKRIDDFALILEKLIDDDMKKRLQEDQKSLQNEVQRQMGVLVATALKNHFNLQFYSQIARQYYIKRTELLLNYNNRLKWARGSGATNNELDDTELKVIEALKNQVKRALQGNMLQKLFQYFKQNFYFDQHQARYDYNLLNDEKAKDIFTEAKQMAYNLIKNLNNFKLEPQRRSSMIFTDIEDEDATKPLLQSNSILAIQQNFEKRAADEYATVVRKRSQAHMKQVPTYLFAIIFFFIYDDLWFSYQEYPIIHTLLLVLISCIGLIYAVGQGPIVRQITEIFYENAVDAAGKGKKKLQQMRSSKESRQKKD